MQRLVSIVLFATLLWNALPASSRATTGQPVTLNQFLKVRTPGAPVVLPDGSLLMRDWPDGVWQLYRVHPADHGGAPSYAPQVARVERLTEFRDGLSGFSVSPDGRYALLNHATGGDENFRLTLLDLQSKAATVVFDKPNVQANPGGWLRDGSGFFFSANDVSSRDFHVYRYDIATAKTTSLVAREGAWGTRDASADGSRILVGRRVSASESHLYELDVASGKLTEITVAPRNGTASCDAVSYMPADQSVLMVSDLDGRRRLYLKDLKSGAVKPCLRSLGDREIDNATTGTTREHLAVTVNEDGYSVLHLFTLPDLKPVRLPAIDRGVVGGLSLRGSTLSWTLNNARVPGEAFAVTLGRSGASAARQLTWTERQGVDLASFPLPELIRYPSFDGRSIPAFVYLPPGHATGTPLPFVVVYHGGPESQTRPTFNATYQYLLSRGFGVLMPNVRGSTGYGREYQMLDDYRKRWDSVRDGVAAADWLVKSGHATAGRIATYGGSYGGFMSVACIVEDQEAVERGERKERLFGACVDIVGIVNMKTFLERTSDYRRKLREAEYGPLSDTEFLATVSSLHRVDKIQVPVFIGHGFNDPRVPVEEAMQFAAALRKNGRRPRMFIAPDEGHGFVKLDNRIYFGERVAAFLEETLKGVQPVAERLGTP